MPISGKLETQIKFKVTMHARIAGIVAYTAKAYPGAILIDSIL